MTKSQFVEMYGEDPADLLGSDWEAMLEDFDSKE